MKRLIGTSAVLVALCISAISVAEVKKDKDLPKSGSLSTTTHTGKPISVAPEPFGFDELNQREQSPISGSVSRIKPGEWRVKVFNNSLTDTYTADVEVIQRNDSGVVKRDSFSYTIPPKSSKEDSVSEGFGTTGADLNLLKYRNLTAQRAKAQATPEKK